MSEPTRNILSHDCVVNAIQVVLQGVLVVLQSERVRQAAILQIPLKESSVRYRRVCLRVGQTVFAKGERKHIHLDVATAHRVCQLLLDKLGVRASEEHVIAPPIKKGPNHAADTWCLLCLVY